ncbi:MAG TPA: membrane protein insertase YidC [Acidobacteriota bacterium]|jgi:YidC/Oxa1 family membrane protein insertase
MEKRLLVAVVLSMAILLVTQYLLQKLYPPVRPQRAAPAISVPANPAPAAKLQPPAPEPGPLPQTSGTRRDLVIENDDYRAVVNTQGAVLKSFELKRYQSKSGNALELIPQKFPPDVAAPLALEVPRDPAIGQRVNQGVFEARIAGGPAQDHLVPPISLSFEYRDAQLQVQKSLKFYADRYLVEVSARLWSNGQQQGVALLLGPDIGTEAGETESDFQQREVVASVGDGSVERDAFPKGKNRAFTSVYWAGFDTKYFAVVAIPEDQFAWLQVNRFDIKQKGNAGKDSFVPYYQIHCPVDAKPVKLYLGPKDYDVLNSLKPGLVGIINYGWFSFLVKPLLLSLKYIHRFVRNWGVAIIVLTFLISLALFPIRYKQMVSMKKMQALQPKMRSIQDRYKKYKRTDPKRQEMNVEIMALYKEHGVNPLGGCLPLVLQMPFLLAFYRMLDAALELRGAPFFLWIHDLSKMDPYYVTPILMGVSMLVQQKMTPQPSADPAQARMMMMMPIVFTAMFLTFSSGLVVYFLFSNLFAVGFQKLAEKWMPDEQAPDKQRKKLNRAKG